MSREDIVAVGIRVFAIFLLVTVARWIPGAVALMGQDPLLPSPSPVHHLDKSAISMLWAFDAHRPAARCPNPAASGGAK